MTDTIPHSLFLTQRALCSGCGAPLSLKTEQIVAACMYCGCESSVDRRLRTVESELHESERSAGRSEFVPAHTLQVDGFSELKCPGCGSEIRLRAAQDVAACKHCGSNSKVERRLTSSVSDPCAAVAFDAELTAFHPEDYQAVIQKITERNNDSAAYKPSVTWDEHNDVRMMVMLTTADSDLLKEVAQDFKPWDTVDSRRECLFTRLLQRIPSMAAGDAKLLLERVIRPMGSAGLQSRERFMPRVGLVVRAAARTVFREDTGEELLQALTFTQPNAMLKLLLELAEWAQAKGFEPLCETVLSVAAQSLDFREGMYQQGRDSVDRESLSEVLLYRLLYLPPRLLDWVLEQVPRWQIHDYRVLARFIDDCMFERPELVQRIRDARIAKPKPATSLAEYLAHLEFVSTLLSPEAREYAMYLHTYHPHAGRSDEPRELQQPILDQLLPMLSEPRLRKHIGFDLAQLIKSMNQTDLQAMRTFLEENTSAVSAYALTTFRKHTASELTIKYSVEPSASSQSVGSESTPTTHKRESEFMREEARLSIAKTAADKAHELGKDRARRIESQSSSWNPLPKAQGHYQRILLEQRRDGLGGALHMSSPFVHDHVHRIQMHWLEYEQTFDPRYKDIIERHELALEFVLDAARQEFARSQATKLAGRPWYRVLWDRLKRRRKSTETS